MGELNKGTESEEWERVGVWPAEQKQEVIVKIFPGTRTNRFFTGIWIKTISLLLRVLLWQLKELGLLVVYCFGFMVLSGKLAEIKKGNSE